MLDYEMANNLFFYEPNTGLVRRKIKIRNHNIGDIVGSIHSKGYIQTEIQGKAYFVHRIAWLLNSGSWPKYEIDHINGIKTDNRICNLRDVPSVINQRNRKKTRSSNKSGRKGVSFNKSMNRWIVSINKTKGVQTYLGCFENIEDAIKVRKMAEDLYYAD